MFSLQIGENSGCYGTSHLLIKGKLEIVKIYCFVTRDTFAKVLQKSFSSHADFVQMTDFGCHRYTDV